MYISFKQRNMKNIMSSSASRQCKSICNQPYSFKYFKWPTVSWWQLGTTSKIQGTRLFPQSEVNMIPNTKLSVHPMLISIAFLSILGCFQILPDLYNLPLPLLDQFCTNHNSVHRIIPSHGCPTPPAIQRFIWTHPQVLAWERGIIKKLECTTKEDVPRAR